MRALVVTADDVGLHAGMTRGALEAHDRGLVTAVSVVAGGAALEPALEQLRDRPSLDVGVHLTLVGERPLSPPAAVPSLLGRDGAFLPHVRDFARRYVLGGIAAAEVEAELRRQIERLLAGGLPSSTSTPTSICTCFPISSTSCCASPRSTASRSSASPASRPRAAGSLCDRSKSRC